MPLALAWSLNYATLAASLLAGQRRSFRRDALRWMAQRPSVLKVEGRLPDFGERGWVLVMNHFARPGFRAWWIALAVSSLIPREIHWVMTSTFTYVDSLRATWLSPLSTFLLTRLARCYGFTSMPPMPPRPCDVEARAIAVRRVLAVAGASSAPVIAMAPEGADAPGGVLQPLWPGTGRFLIHLARRGLLFLPFGIFEVGDQLCVRVGEPFRLALPRGSSPQARDEEAAEMVARAIAVCLPAPLRGRFA